MTREGRVRWRVKEKRVVEGIVGCAGGGEGADRDSRQSHCDDRDAPTSRDAICPLVTSKSLLVVIVRDTAGVFPRGRALFRRGATIIGLPR